MVVWGEVWILPCTGGGGEERETVFCWNCRLAVCEICPIGFDEDRFSLGAC